MGSDLRQAFAVILDDVANGLRALGDVLGAQPAQRGSPSQPAIAADRLAEIVRESRAVLTELVLLDVDPKQNPDLWLVQGSMLSAVDQILTQLDLDLKLDEPGLRLAALPEVAQRQLRQLGRRWPHAG